MKKTLLAGVLLSVFGCTSSPTNPSPSTQGYAAAETAYRNGDYSGAISTATQIIAENPGMAKPYFLRAKSYQAKEKWKEAEADFAMAINKSSEENRSVYLFWRGLFFSDRQLHEKALLDLSRACELQLRFPSTQYYLECFRSAAATRISLGQFEAAQKDCDFILSKNPDKKTRREFEALKLEAIQGRRNSAR
jgi:tetratricopeptide (TPR) repeat protein